MTSLAQNAPEIASGDRMKDLRSLVAPTLQALKRMELNKWHRLIAMDIVDGTLSLGRQWMVVRQQRDLGGLRRELSEGELSRVLNGYEQVVAGRVERFAGLIELGLIAKRELAEGFLIVFNPDWKSWGCREMHQGADRAAWRSAVDAQAREYERQSVFGEVEERFSLAALLSDGQVGAALALARGDVVTAGGGGPGIERQERAVVGRPSCAGDAPERRPEREAARSSGGVTWENPKCIPEQRRGDLGKSQVSLKELKDYKTESPLRPLRACSLSDLKAKTQSEDEHEAMSAMAEVFNRCNGGWQAWEGVGRTYSDGAKWRVKWRDGCQRSAVRSAFAHVVTDLIEHKKIHAIGGHCHTLWRDFSSQKKSRNLLNIQH